MIYPKDMGQAVAQVGPKNLMEAALRMRPDRVIFPELRDGTAYYFLRAVASGHPGVITTVHANDCRMAWEVLTLLVRESEGGADLDREDIRGLLKQTVDVVVQIEKTSAGRRVTEVEFNDRGSGSQYG
jgi:type IV secretion system protein VirB11